MAVVDLQSTINKQGRNWQAGPTSISALPQEEVISRLGLQVNEAERKATEKLIAAANSLEAVRAAAIAVPAAVDWRSNGGNFVTPIRDQLSCGSCVSFGTLATIEARVNIACRTPGGARDYSEAFLFYCGCGRCCGSGWNFVPALDFCKNQGVAAESSFPYTPGDQPCKSGVTPLFKISGHSSVLSMSDRKAAIAERGPVVAGMNVWRDFKSYSSGVYHHVTGEHLGYHAVSVVGYDDAQRCWICKNSWGPGWGESGFFRMSYDDADSEMSTSFAFYEPQVQCPSPQPTPVDDCKQYVAHLRRVIIAARGNSRLRVCLRYYVCGRGRRPFCPASHMAVVRIVQTILQRCPQYRAPFCVAIG